MAPRDDEHEHDRSEARERAARRCVEDLVAGALTPQAFLLQTAALVGEDPDAVWDVLGFLDQQYRVGRVTAEVFQPLRRELQSRGLAPHLWRTAAAELAAADAADPVDAAQPQDAAVAATAEPVASPREAAPATAPEPPSDPSPEPPPASSDAVPPGISAPDASGALVAEPRITPTAPVVGAVLHGRYRLTALVQSDARFMVFRATDEAPGTSHAALLVKVVVPGTPDTGAAQADLRREFHVLQGLSHPAIPRVFVLEEGPGVTFYTGAPVEGEPLAAILAARGGEPFGNTDARALLRDVGATIAYAQAHGIVHGSLSPEAIVVGGAGELWVRGFGTVPARPLPDAIAAYASPQRAAGEAAHPRDDIYALACLANLLLVGVHPFGERSGLEARIRGLRPVSASGLAPAVWLALRAGLEFDRERRPGDVGAWLRQLNPAADRLMLAPLATLMNVAAPPRVRLGAVRGSALAILIAAGGLFLAHQLTGDMSSAPVDSPPPSAPAPEPAPAAHLRASTPAAPTARAEAPAATSPQPASAPTPTVAPPVPSPVAAPVVRAPPPRESRPQPAAPAHAPPPVARTPAAPLPPARVELSTGRVDVEPGAAQARITVRRRGNLRGEAGFVWALEPGTAKPDEDYAAMSARAERIPAGSDRVTLTIPLLANPRRHDARRFYVLLDSTGDGVELGETTSALVVIPPVP